MNPNEKDERGCNLLMMSCFYNKVELLKYLIDVYKMDPKETNQDKCTPLMVSCYYGHLEIVKFLVETHKLDPSTKDLNGSDCLMLAS